MASNGWLANPKKLNMASVTYCAALLDAETGGNETYEFEANADLFQMPARDIVDTFIKHLDTESSYPSPMSYELNSAVKKKSRRIVMATGSLLVAKGEIPFLLMISPQIRERST
jgi:hypothetical protein